MELRLPPCRSLRFAEFPASAERYRISPIAFSPHAGMLWQAVCLRFGLTLAPADLGCLANDVSFFYARSGLELTRSGRD